MLSNISIQYGIRTKISTGGSEAPTCFTLLSTPWQHEGWSVTTSLKILSIWKTKQGDSKVSARLQLNEAVIQIQCLLFISINEYFIQGQTSKEIRWMKSESVSYRIEESTLDLRYWSTIRFDDSLFSQIFFSPLYSHKVNPYTATTVCQTVLSAWYIM